MRAWLEFALVCAITWFANPLAAIANASDAALLADGATAENSLPNSDYEAPDALVPRWSARVGAVILQRSRPEPQPLITSLSGPKLLDASDYSFNFQGGPDVYLIRRGERADMDFRYFGVSQWSSGNKSISDPNGVQFEFADPSQTQVNSPVTIGTTYFSALQSVETNLRQNVSSRFTLLAGFRYISLREHIAFNIGIPQAPSLVDASLGATNNLYGFQIGADGILWDHGGPLRLEGVIKAGVYGNSAQSNLDVNQMGGSQFLSGGRNHTAFVGDVNFSGVYQINDRWAARAGYQLLWISGVALASDQMHVIDPNLGTVNQVDVHGSPFYHGVLLGLERTW